MERFQHVHGGEKSIPNDECLWFSSRQSKHVALIFFKDTRGTINFLALIAIIM